MHSIKTISSSAHVLKGIKFMSVIYDATNSQYSSNHKPFLLSYNSKEELLTQGFVEWNRQ